MFATYATPVTREFAFDATMRIRPAFAVLNVKLPDVQPDPAATTADPNKVASYVNFN
jgi:hypothetical protein